MKMRRETATASETSRIKETERSLYLSCLALDQEKIFHEETLAFTPSRQAAAARVKRI